VILLLIRVSRRIFVASFSSANVYLMPKKSSGKPKTKSSRKPHAAPKGMQVHRFAHPFFTTTPISERKAIPGVGHRMTDYIEKTLLPFPVPQRTTPMTLDDIIGTDGAQSIEAAGYMLFHAVGDTGHDAGKAEEAVARAMAADYDAGQPAGSPAFFLHLGDVNYFQNTDVGYQAQFYTPYKEYPGKIIAIPGNHDGELFITSKGKNISTGQTTSLEEFCANFCQPKPGVPPAAGSIYRQMISQPGVYWLLNTPFADIIGLYSNVAENPGYIAASTIGNSQKTWLTGTLKNLAAGRAKGEERALILAVHHPPIASATLGSHGPSTAMLADIDACCTAADLTPDLFLTGHAHNYQRWTRKFSFGGSDYQTPFFVAGTGGRGTDLVAKADNSTQGEFTYEESFVGYGHLTVRVDTKSIVVTVYTVDETTAARTLYETVSLDLASHTVTHG
jgi:hypothetical protein